MSDGNFLVDFVNLNKNTEIPEEFALWSGIAGISCMLGRRVWVDMGRYKIFPNMYILLVAESGRMRKSTSIDQIVDLIRQVEPQPNIIAQSLTPQALIESLSCKPSTDPSNFGAEVCVGFGFADEMSTFLNRQTYEMGLAPLLIQFYDCKKEYVYRTKARGEEILKNTCFGLHAASTMDWIRSGIPAESIGAGLTSRMIFVYAEFDPRRNKPIAITKYTRDELSLMDSLVRSVKRVSSIPEGEAVVTREALDFYEKSYGDWYYKTGVPFYEHPCLTGYASRRYVHMFKLGLIFAASGASLDDRQRLVITSDHLEGAVAALSAHERQLPRLMEILTSNDRGDMGRMILKKLRQNGGSMTREQLCRQTSHRLSSRELTDVIETLTAAGEIIISVTPNGIIMYTITPGK